MRNQNVAIVNTSKMSNSEIMERSEKALEYFDNKFNCAQSVLVSFAGQLGLSEDEALRVACAFGGGMGRQQYTCGAVTGAAMALGAKFGKGKSDPDEKKQFTYDKTVELFKEFGARNGSTECYRLLNELNMNNDQDLAKITEQNLFHTNCRKYVSDAVKITEQLMENGLK